MTYREFMGNHNDMTLEWCSAYRTDDGLYSVIMYEWDVLAISSPTIEANRYDGSLTEATMEQFARKVNPYYDDYVGRTDVQIALEMMHQVGCANCPYFDRCELMGDEMEVLTIAPLPMREKTEE